MNIPKIPTDNLYKFMAITGLIFFLSSPILLGTLFYFTVMKITQIEYNFRILEAKAMVEETELKRRGDSSISPEKYLNLKTQLIDIRRKAQELNFLVSMGYIAGIAIILLGAGGLVATIYGFGLWFQRLQVFQDQKIRAGPEDSSNISHR